MMVFPHDAAMLTMIAIAFDDRITVADGTMILEINGSGLLPDHGTATVALKDADLAELEDRGWVEHCLEGPQATEKGRYWLERWWNARKPKRGVNANKGRHPSVLPRIAKY